MNRPLPDEYLDYARQDAYLIYSLYEHFSRAGYLSLVSGEQSMRYVSLHRDSPPRRDGDNGGGDMYVSHPLLPLGILGKDPIEGLTKTCGGCNRLLSLFAFAAPFEVGRRCFVCRAVDVRRRAGRRQGRGRQGQEQGRRTWGIGDHDQQVFTTTIVCCPS